MDTLLTLEHAIPAKVISINAHSAVPLQYVQLVYQVLHSSMTHAKHATLPSPVALYVLLHQYAPHAIW